MVSSRIGNSKNIVIATNLHIFMDFVDEFGTVTRNVA